MAREDYVAGVIAELGRDLGISDLALDSHGQLTLEVGEVPVTFSLSTEPADLLWLYVGLGEVANGDRQVLTFLLQFGHVLWAKNLMTLGLDDEGQGICGYSSIAVVALNAQRLAELLSAMLEAAEEVRRRLAQRDFVLVPEQPPTPGRPDPGELLRV
jgi:hypothetical protein